MNKAKPKKSALTFVQAVKQLKKDSLAPVYFIYGEERFLHEEMVNKILDISVEPSTRDFNYDMFYGNEADIEKVISIARSYPMMAERRSIVIKDMHKLKPSAVKTLGTYAKSPSQSTCMILTFPKKSLTGQGIRTISNNSVAVDCRELYENETISWIKTHAAGKNLKIEDRAVLKLYEFVGNSLLSLIGEIEKIQTNIAPRNNVTLADVKNITSASRQNSVYDLCDAVGEKNFSKSILILNNLMDIGEKPTGMIIQLYRHMTNLLKISESIRLRKNSPGELASLTRLHPFFVNKIKTQVKNYNINQLRHAFISLATADYHLKTSYQPPKLVMELALYQLIKGK